MQTTFRMKRYFFDRPAVERAVGKPAVRALGQFGKFVRRRARSSIRRRKRVSDPGQPPSAHSQHEPNLKTILYAYDPQRKSVVIGPVKLNQVDRDSGLRPVSGLVPEILEGGGIIAVDEWRLPDGRWVRRDRRFRRRGNFRQQRTRRVTIAARPFMGPAFQEELAEADDYFRDLVRK